MLKRLSLLLITILMTANLAGCDSDNTISVNNTNEGTSPAIQGPIVMETVTMISDDVARIETVLGNIDVQLFTKEIPELSKNFIELTKAGNYNGVPFHRVVPGFVIQGGDFTNKDGSGGHSYKGPGAENELPGEYDPAVSSNVRGTLSMANRGPDTNGSQFFINLADNLGLDHDKQPLTSQHPVFGKVISGMDVVDKIAAIGS